MSEKFKRLTLAEVRKANFKKRLENGLRQMGPENVKQPYRKIWSAKNPGLGYCYVIFEMLHHLVVEKTTPKVLRTRLGTHWFLEPDDGKEIDFAKDDNYDYSKGIRRTFITQHMSKRAKLLTKVMGL